MEEDAAGAREAFLGYLDLDMAFDEGRHKLELNLNGVSKGIYRISIVTMNGNKSVSLAIQ